MTSLVEMSHLGLKKKLRNVKEKNYGQTDAEKKAIRKARLKISDISEGLLQ